MCRFITALTVQSRAVTSSLVQNKTGFTGVTATVTLWNVTASQSRNLSTSKWELKCNQVSLPAYAWQVVAPPHTIVTFTSCLASCVLDVVTVHTRRVSCHHLHPSMNNVWTRRTENINTRWKMQLAYFIYTWFMIWSAFFCDFQIQADFFCFILLPIHLHPLSTTSCHYFSWIHARVHKSPICRDIWWTRQGLQESGPV